MSPCKKSTAKNKGISRHRPKLRSYSSTLNKTGYSGYTGYLSAMAAAALRIFGGRMVSRTEPKRPEQLVLIQGGKREK
jgi:hypothetical protein